MNIKLLVSNIISGTFCIGFIILALLHNTTCIEMKPFLIIVFMHYTHLLFLFIEGMRDYIDKGLLLNIIIGFAVLFFVISLTFAYISLM